MMKQSTRLVGLFAKAGTSGEKMNEELLGDKVYVSGLAQAF